MADEVAARAATQALNPGSESQTQIIETQSQDIATQGPGTQVVAASQLPENTQPGVTQPVQFQSSDSQLF